MNEMILVWLSEFEKTSSSVDVEFFWQEFFNFFMEEVMHHDSINCYSQNIRITTCIDQARLKKTEIKQMHKALGTAQNKEQALNQFIKRQTNLRGIQRLCIGNGYIFNAAKIAEYANNFLVSVMNDPVEAEQKNWPNTSKPFELTEQIVYDAIISLNPRSLHSSGILLMTPEMLQKTAKASSKVLYLLYKMSMEQQKVPSDWRHTLITLKHKDDRLDRIENYRPIGITCAPSKVIHGINSLNLI